MKRNVIESVFGEKGHTQRRSCTQQDSFRLSIPLHAHSGWFSNDSFMACIIDLPTKKGQRTRYVPQPKQLSFPSKRSHVTNCPIYCFSVYRRLSAFFSLLLGKSPMFQKIGRSLLQYSTHLPDFVENEICTLKARASFVLSSFTFQKLPR